MAVSREQNDHPPVPRVARGSPAGDGERSPGASALGSLLGVQALNRLAGDLGYDLKGLIEAQEHEPSQLSGRRDDQVRDGRSAMLAVIGEKCENLDRSVLNRRGQVFHLE